MTPDNPQMTDLELAFEALRTMPQSATLAQIIEELEILAAVRQGEAAIDAGRFLTHEEVEKRSAEWTN